MLLDNEVFGVICHRHKALLKLVWISKYGITIPYPNIREYQQNCTATRLRSLDAKFLFA